MGSMAASQESKYRTALNPCFRRKFVVAVQSTKCGQQHCDDADPGYQAGRYRPLSKRIANGNMVTFSITVFGRKRLPAASSSRRLPDSACIRFAALMVGSKTPFSAHRLTPQPGFEWACVSGRLAAHHAEKQNAALILQDFFNSSPITQTLCVGIRSRSCIRGS